MKVKLPQIFAVLLVSSARDCQVRKIYSLHIGLGKPKFVWCQNPDIFMNFMIFSARKTGIFPTISILNIRLNLGKTHYSVDTFVFQ
jgi:hypothetical protein